MNKSKTFTTKAVYGLIPVIGILVLTGMVGCTLQDGDGEVTEIRERKILMDTAVDMVVETSDPSEGERALQAAEEEMQRLEEKMSRHISDSEVQQINQQAGVEPVQVSDETFEVIKGSIELSERMEGYFDISVAPALELWGFGEEEFRVPSEDEILEVLDVIDYRLIELDPDDQTVFLPKPNMAIDLGGVAKGYIVDRAAEVLAEFDVHSGMIDGGGDIRSTGPKHDDRPWRIGVRHPRGTDHFAVIELTGEAVTTSGDYERYFTENDTRYHHIIDPFTGKPTEGVMSATVVAPDTLSSDVYSTGAFGLGIEKSLELFTELEGVEAILVDHEGNYYLTPGLSEEEVLLESYVNQQLK